MTSSIEREWIERHVPHHGRMCLLDRVVSWDEEHIHCTSSTHRDIENPLRDNGRLAAVCATEYGAQATAIHGALLSCAASPAPRPPQKGYLVSVRDLTITSCSLDSLETDLDLFATRVSANAQGAQYEIKVMAEAFPVLSGRVMIKFVA